MTDTTEASAAAPPVPPIELTDPGRYHVVGVGGPGMSAVAIALAEMGHQVSGSDLRDLPVLDRVRAAGIEVHVGHAASHVVGVDAVTASTAVPETNLELQAARERGVTVLRRAGMLAAICAQARSIGVAGTHGKTTTSSMLMLMLAEAGLKPGFVIGGDVADVGAGAQWTGSEWFVVEADESDGTHLELPLHATVLTNVEADHLDHYGSFDAIVAGFERYLRQIPGPKALCFDDPVCVELADRLGSDAGIVGYGTSARADVRAVELRAERGSFRFGVERHGESIGEVRLPLRGVHNVLNACGALALALDLGVPAQAAIAALERFGGVARRFDLRGEHGGATFIDDYAHLPSEIGAVLTAARDSGDGWRRLVAVFQPNRFNRMAVLWPEYADAFEAADLVVLTDIYSSGTQVLPGVTGKLVVNAVLDKHPETHVVWLPHRADLVEYLARSVGAGDACISMGCGDVASLPDEVIARRLEMEARG